MKPLVYALSTCPYCKGARAYLTEKGVEFDVIEVDFLTGAERETVLAEVKRVSGGMSFPVIVAGDAVVVGFDRARIDELLGADA